MAQTLTRSNGLLLALSLACFGVAGVANTAIGATARSVLAVAVAIVGVYGLARYARSVARPTLARTSLALWVAFLAVAAIHAVGPEAAAGAAPGPVPSAAIVIAITGFTWATLLGALSATSFLAAREYGATTGAENPEDRVLDQDLDL